MRFTLEDKTKYARIVVKKENWRVTNLNNSNFEQSIFSTEYSFASPRGLVRVMSDSFSKQFCDTKGAIKHAAVSTQGKCLYCGDKMYELLGDSPVFDSSIHYDHIYPASKMNLFEVGNVAISCEPCNLEKSNRLPMDYYDKRVAEGKPVLIEDRDLFENELERITEPYREKWPEHYSAGLEDLKDSEFKQKMQKLLFEKIDISAAVNKYSYDTSKNKDIWQEIIDKAYELYSDSTAKDVLGRVGYTNEFFEEMFGYDKDIESCSLQELKEFSMKLLMSKQSSKNEISKYRMVLKILFGVVADKTTMPASVLNDNLPTYSKLNKD